MSEGKKNKERIWNCKIKFPCIGIIFAIMSSVFYSLNIVFAKVLTIPPMQVALSRIILQYCFILPFLLKMNTANVDQIIGHKETRMLLWLRGLTGAIAELFLYLSIKNLSAGNAVTLSFLDVIFVPILGRICFKEPFTIFDAIFAFLAFCGVILVARPPFLFTHLKYDSSESAVGVTYAILGALCASASYILIRKMGKRVHFLNSIFSFTLVGVIVNSILLSITGDFQYPCLWEFLFILLMALSAFFGSLMLTLALQNERAGTVTVLMTLQIIIVYSIQVLFLHDIPSTLSLIGSSLILSTSIFIGGRKIVNERRNRQ